MARDLFGSPDGRVACVALPLPVDRLFDYAVPEALASQAPDLTGRRVRGRAGGRVLVGVVVEERSSGERQERSSGGAQTPSATRRHEPGAEGRQEGSSDARPRDGLRPLEAVLDAAPVLAPSLLGPLREEAREALCPLGLALAAAIPPGSAPRVERGLALGPRGTEALRHGAARGAAARVLEALADGPLPESELRRRLGRAAPDAAALARLERERLVVRTVVERGPRVRAAARRVARLADGVDPEAACEGPLARAPAQARLVRALAAGPRPGDA
ncbi:MAG: hypothetical protein R3263_12305, partial [Myxococcota bacterium]|nr:hypothetical protein [Myxococcota bacterium]